MKTIYFIRHAKASHFGVGESDFERSLAKKGYKQIKTIGSYLKLTSATPDAILSSCALRSQQTAVELAKIVEYEGKIAFLEQLYVTSAGDVLDMLELQDDEIDSLYIVGHHPYITELVNRLSKEHIAKIPPMGVVCITFDIPSWNMIKQQLGKLDFFIFPKQFEYYMPGQIKTKLRQ